MAVIFDYLKEIINNKENKLKTVSTPYRYHVSDFACTARRTGGYYSKLFSLCHFLRHGDKINLLNIDNYSLT